MDNLALETKVSISTDKMSASINLVPPTNSDSYTVDQVIQILNDNNVKLGINTKMIEQIIENKMYYRSFEIARGKQAINGEDGYFKYYFDTSVNNKKPKLLEDGSVDYLNMKTFETVQEGQKIAEYVQPTNGQYGYSVNGTLITPKRGKNIPSLRGKGFAKVDDKDIYISKINGKITLEDGKINISNLYEVKEVNVKTGNISFIGDVIVNGNVGSGMTIVSHGSIVVEGNVEDATLVASKDIILKRGMQGKGIGKIKSGANVSGKFFEDVIIEAKGSVRANYVLNCEIVSDEDVVLDGRYGLILGGSVKATKQIVATTIGNQAETPTKIEVGISQEILDKYNELGKKIEKVKAELNLLQKSLDIFEKIEQKSNVNEANPRKVKVFRAKIIKNSELNGYEEERKNILSIIEKGTGSTVYVSGYVYPGVRVTIDSFDNYVKSEFKNITFKLRGMDVVMISNLDA